MKKRLFVFLAALITVMPLAARPPMAASIDLGVAQDLLKKTCYQINADYRIRISDDFEARVPVTFSLAEKKWIIDAGISINYYPFDNGLYFGINAVEFGYTDSAFMALNEISAGWTFNFKTKLIIEPEIVIRDPSGTYSDEYSALKGTFSSYSTFRVRLKAGYKF